MTKTILEAKSIASASGWYVEDSGAPIACFALVIYVDNDHPTLGHAQCVIPLTETDMMDDLNGRAMDDFPLLVHKP